MLMEAQLPEFLTSVKYEQPDCSASSSNCFRDDKITPDRLNTNQAADEWAPQKVGIWQRSKVQFSLCLIQLHATKEYGRLVVQLYALTSTPEEMVSVMPRPL